MSGTAGRSSVITDEIANDVSMEGSELRIDKRWYSDGLDDSGSIPGSAFFLSLRHPDRLRRPPSLLSLYVEG